MLQTLGENTESENLRACHCFVTRQVVCENTGQLWHLSQPAAVVLAFAVNVEVNHTSCVGPILRRAGR